MATSPVPAASPKSALLSAQASLLQSLQKLTLQQNYVPARLPEGKVVGIWGEAIVRMPDGEVRRWPDPSLMPRGRVKALSSTPMSGGPSVSTLAAPRSISSSCSRSMRLLLAAAGLR